MYRVLIAECKQEVSSFNPVASHYDDFTHAFGNAREHDVHDADAADEKADAGDEATADPGIADEALNVLRPIFLGAEREIFDALVGGHENVVNLLNG